MKEENRKCSIFFKDACGEEQTPEEAACVGRVHERGEEVCAIKLEQVDGEV